MNFRYLHFFLLCYFSIICFGLIAIPNSYASMNTNANNIALKMGMNRINIRNNNENVDNSNSNHNTNNSMINTDDDDQQQNNKKKSLIAKYQNIETKQSKVSFHTNAPQAILIDHTSGIILYEKNANTHTAPSSMTKMMTMYLTFQHLKNGSLSLKDALRVSVKASKMGGSKMFIEQNKYVLVEDLIRGAIVQSGNDACIAIAEGIFGEEAVFVEYMNKTALQLGMVNTHFSNSTGWPDNYHFSTVHDLAILGSSIIKDFPEYYHYFSEKEFTYNNIKQKSHNALIGISGVDGIKTGHTESGGWGIVVSALNTNKSNKIFNQITNEIHEIRDLNTDSINVNNDINFNNKKNINDQININAKNNNQFHNLGINDIRLIAVVNGLSIEKDRLQESEKLLNYGFNNFIRKTIVLKGQNIVKTKVMYGELPNLNLTVEEDIMLLMPRNNSYNNISVKALFYDNIVAPIVAGQEIGELIVIQNNIEIKKVPLVASKAVNKANLIQKILQNFEYLVLDKLLN